MDIHGFLYTYIHRSGSMDNGYQQLQPGFLLIYDSPCTAAVTDDIMH